VVNGQFTGQLIDQSPHGSGGGQCPYLLGALTTCHPRNAIHHYLQQEGATGLARAGQRHKVESSRSARQLRFPNQDVASKKAETDQPTSHRRICGFRLGRYTRAQP
jgi:hypothetical protein